MSTSSTNPATGTAMRLLHPVPETLSVDVPAQDNVLAPETEQPATADEKPSRKERRAAKREAAQRKPAQPSWKERHAAKQAARKERRSAEAVEREQQDETRRVEKAKRKSLATAETSALLNYQSQTRVIKMARFLSLAGVAVLVTSATAVAFIESFHALYEWAAGHGISSGWALFWPLQIDTFIAVGELTLFVAIVDNWPTKARTWSWTVSLGGLAVSVAGNVGQVKPGHPVSWQFSAAVPPLAAAAGITVGFQALKWYMHVMQKREAERIKLTGVDVPTVTDSVVDVPPATYTLTREPEPAPEPKTVAAEPAAKELKAASEPVKPIRLREPQNSNEKWKRGVEIFTASLEAGTELSQRKLAEELGMKSRQLASLIITHVKNERNEGAS